MYLTELKLTGFRCYSSLDLKIPAEANPVVVVGQNGAGKTSILEAIYLCTRGRSFRTSLLREVIARDKAESLIGITFISDDVKHRIYQSIQKSAREIRIDGRRARGWAEIAEAIPVQYVDGETAYLVDGGPHYRRRFLDWVLFHVEQGFLDVWKAWRQSYRQMLAARSYGKEINPWLETFERHSEALSRYRYEIVRQLSHGVESKIALPTFMKNIRLSFRRGWKDGQPLKVMVKRFFENSSNSAPLPYGPQRDDLQIFLNGAPASHFSRGQKKLLVFVLLQAQIQLIRKCDRRTILLVDDLASDLDARNQMDAYHLLKENVDQLWLTAINGTTWKSHENRASLFHVKP